MKDFFIIKHAIDKNILININNEIISEFNHFLSKNENIGGLNSGNINATIGKHADTLHALLVNSEIFKEAEEFFDISLEDYFLTVGCNLNVPGSMKQHIHSDTDFDKSIIIINIPTVDVNERNGSTEIYPKTNHQPLSYLKFLLTYSGTPIRLNTDLGDIIIRDSRVWHRGTENLSKDVRPMISFTLAKKTSRVIPDKFQGAWDPFVLQNTNFPKEIEFLNNWFTDGFLSATYERVIIKLPFIRSIKRIIFSVIKPTGSAT